MGQGILREWKGKMDDRIDGTNKHADKSISRTTNAIVYSRHGACPRNQSLGVAAFQRSGPSILLHLLALKGGTWRMKRLDSIPKY